MAIHAQERHYFFCTHRKKLITRNSFKNSLYVVEENRLLYNTERDTKAIKAQKFSGDLNLSMFGNPILELVGK